MEEFITEMSKEIKESFHEAFTSLEEENKIETEVLIEKIKGAMLKAVKKAYPDCEDNISIEINPETKTLNMFITQTVVEDEPTYFNEVNIDAAKLIDKNAYVGGTIKAPLEFSRAAAQTAKQSIKGDIREINRAQLIEKFEKLEGDCVTALVSQVEPTGTATVIYDNTELYLFPKDQIPGETLVEGSSVKIYIVGIINRSKKPVVKISRSRKELVKRLFELEVPEIYDGTVEIKSISREAGSRTKIAVWSKDKNVDPVGSCIGPKKTRITNILRELGGEKIDIILWDENPEVFIAKALAPAKVIRTVIYPGDVSSCMVIVPEDQLSLAIGNRGQNAKLAARLTNFKIDIKPETDPEAQKAIKMADELMEIKEDEDLFAPDSENEQPLSSDESSENDQVIDDETEILTDNKDSAASENTAEDAAAGDDAPEPETAEDTAPDTGAQESRTEENSCGENI